MKRIIKSKKSQLGMLQSIMYDLLFVVILSLALFAIIRTVDSGMYFWRRFYAVDTSLLMSVAEGVEDDFTYSYIEQHRGSIFGKTVKLDIFIEPGIVSVYSQENPNHKTIKPFVTQKNSQMYLNSPLESFIIEKTNSVLGLTSTAPTSCNTYNVPVKNFVETSIHTNIDSGKLNEIKTDFEEKILLKYNRLFVQEDFVDYNTASCLYSKNIVDNSIVPEVLIDLKYVDSGQNRITIKYPNKGDISYAATLSCQIFNNLKANLGKIKKSNPNLRLNIEHKSSSGIDFIGDSNTAMVVITFETPEHYFNQEFYDFVSNSMFLSLEKIMSFDTTNIEC